MYTKEDVMKVLQKQINKYGDMRYDGADTESTLKALKETREEILKLEHGITYCPRCGFTVVSE